MTEILMAGLGIKLLRWERDLLILTCGMRDSFKVDGGMRVEKQKITRYGHYAENCDAYQSVPRKILRVELNGGIKPKTLAGCGIEKA